MSTDWDQCYRSGETPWDKGTPAPPLVDWLARSAQMLTGEVLVPGCGLGHDVRALARSTSAQIMGLDVSETALGQARQFPAAGNETYVQADLFNPPPELCGRFDWIVEHTCFCAIDPARREDYVRAVARFLRPGGQLFAIFYLRPWERGEAVPPGGGPPFGTSAEGLDRLFSGHFTLLEEWVPARAYAGREGRELVRLLKRSNPV